MKNNRPISVIGAGCIGSNLIPFLARMGFEAITVYDFDKVEEHNLKNQIYRPQDIGRDKVEVLAEIIRDSTGLKITPKAQRVENERLSEVVICCVDSMKVRRAIWNNCIKLQTQVGLYIEARVGGPALRVYSLDPTDCGAIGLYEENLYEDGEAPQCALGEIPTLAAVVSVICGLLKKTDEGTVLPTETIVDVDSWSVLSQ